MYSRLKTDLDNFNSYLDSVGSSRGSAVAFGAELLPANANRGEQLLRPDTMNGVKAYLDRLKEMGLKGVTIAVKYPVYTPSFPRYEEYRSFFKQVSDEVHKRGMVLDVETGFAFAGTAFSTLNISYSGLTFNRYEVEQRTMVTSLIEDLKPEYLNLGAEPDTEYKLSGLKEFANPDRYMEYVNFILAGLDKGSTAMGAGIGSWGDMAYIDSLANTRLDFLDIHVYPATEKYLKSILTIADIAKSHGKRVCLDEAWLYKVDTVVSTDIAANEEIFKRDAYSFWAPLDQEFLSVIVKVANMKGIEYVSPFWSQLFFSYIDYNGEIGKLSYAETAQRLNQQASKNIVEDKFSPTGEYYRKLITG